MLLLSRINNVLLAKTLQSKCTSTISLQLDLEGEGGREGGREEERVKEREGE